MSLATSSERGLIRPATAIVVALVVVGSMVAAGLAGSAAGASSASSTTDRTPTYVDSDVTSDATWTADDGPYVVTADVTIQSGATLTIEPGTTVQVAEDVTMTVQGSLLADGTAAAPIEFTTARPSPQPGSWEEIRFAGSEDSLLRLENTTVEYGRTAINASNDAGRIEVVDSTIRAHVRAGIEAFDRSGVPTVRVVDSRFAQIGTAGVLYRAQGTNPYLDSAGDLSVWNTEFVNTGEYGVAIRARDVQGVTLAGSTVTGFRNAGVTVATEHTSTLEPSSTERGVEYLAVRDTRIANGRGPGVEVVGGHHQSVSLTGNEIRDVNAAGIRVALAVDISGLDVAGNVVENATTGVAISNRRTSGPIFQVSMAVTGNDLGENDRYGLRIDANHVIVERIAIAGNTLAANGNDGALVTAPTFANTHVTDNVARNNGGTGVELAGGSVTGTTVSGNRVVDNADGGLVVSASGAMSGVQVDRNDAFDNADVGIHLEHHDVGTGRVTLANNTVVANTVGVRLAGPTATRLANNSIAYNTQGSAAVASDDGLGPATGVVVEDAGSNTTLRYNDVYGHVTGLWTDTTGTVHAERNYWGAESGPFHATVNPDGDGNAIETEQGKAAIVPFAESRYGSLFERPTAELTANRTTVTPNGTVRFSAENSTDDAGVQTYYFRVDGERLGARESGVLYHEFEEQGTHEVSVIVEDEHGIESVTAATVEVSVVPERQTTTQPTTTQPTTEPPSDPSNGADEGSSGGSLVDALLSIPGLLGAIPFGFGLALGVLGVLRSMQGRDPPTSGLTVHVFALGGALVWTVAGLLGGGPLLTLGLGVGGAWTGLSGALYVVAIK